MFVLHQQLRLVGGTGGIWLDMVFNRYGTNELPKRTVTSNAE